MKAKIVWRNAVVNGGSKILSLKPISELIPRWIMWPPHLKFKTIVKETLLSVQFNNMYPLQVPKGKKRKGLLEVSYQKNILMINWNKFFITKKSPRVSGAKFETQCIMSTHPTLSTKVPCFCPWQGSNPWQAPRTLITALTTRPKPWWHIS